MRDLTHSKGLIIGLPTLGRPISMEWALAYKALSPPINYNAVAMTIHGRPVAEARNLIAEEALKGNFKYVFFLGDDVVVPNHTLRQLIYRMEQDDSIGVVGGIYFSKSEPPAPLVFRGNGCGSYWDWKVGEFFECTGLGMDCTIIRTSVFQELEKPWFVTIDKDQFLDGIPAAEMWTEDLYFLKNVHTKTKFKIFADATILCKHQDTYSGRNYSLPSESLPTRKPLIEKTKRAIDIGCGPINRQDQFPDHELIRVDIRDDCNPDYRCDVRQLPFANEEFDLIFSSHVLEHFGRGEWRSVFEEWLRVLKYEGEMYLILPNIEWAINNWATAPINDVMNVFYGGQSNDYDFHYNGWWPAQVEAILNEYNFADITIGHNGYNMIIKAKKNGRSSELQNTSNILACV